LPGFPHRNDSPNGVLVSFLSRCELDQDAKGPSTDIMLCPLNADYDIYVCREKHDHHYSCEFRDDSVLQCSAGLHILQ
jgi:hypothetical protein